MKTIVHRNNTRSIHDMGWIKIAASFRPDLEVSRNYFGSMVNFDDAEIKSGEKEGFGFHPHTDMEIISLILEGTMDHKDREGNNGLIKSPAIQAITSGTGILHNEVNGASFPLNMLQIWFLPNKKGIKPNYGVLEFSETDFTDNLKELISPIAEDGKLKISQNVRLSLGQFKENKNIDYKLDNKNNGVYLMVLEGIVQFNNIILQKKDAVKITETENIFIKTIEKETKILIIEIGL